MVQMAMYLIVAVFVFSACLDDPNVMYSGWYGLLASCVFLAVAKLSTNDLYILGLHKNSIGTSLSYGVIVAVELWISSQGRQRQVLGVLLAVLLGGLLSSLCRGAWLGAVGGVMLILLLHRQFRLFARAAALAVPILALCWVLLPDQAKDYASDISLDAYNVKTRLASIDLAYGFFQNNPVLGAGVGLRKEYDATNVVMSTLAETGVMGLVAFVSIYASFGWAVWRARARIVITNPLFPLLAIGSALALCQLLHGMVDHFWGRGSLPAWAGVGMAMYVCTNAIGAHNTRSVGTADARFAVSDSTDILK
jgi:O-antigen ligase